MGKRVVWLLAACTGLVLFLRGDGLAYMAAAPRAVGIGGWGLVGMGFLTVALTALRGDVYKRQMLGGSCSSPGRGAMPKNTRRFSGFRLEHSRSSAFNTSLVLSGI